jgi:small subunit ribosomal protein S21
MTSFNTFDQATITGSKVWVPEGKFEQSIRKFKSKIQDSGLLIELREREAYEKPTTRRKKAAAQAKKRWSRKLEAEMLAPKLY